jgi:phosphoribosylaminoimidazolecarboxamide formyltransferase/IMP cyclohydrolase
MSSTITAVSDKVLTNLAIEVFERTCRYDSAIYEFLNNRFKADNSFSSFPKEINFTFSKLQDLRYGENPHQTAAFYKDTVQREGLGRLSQLQGKELSFNNILDLNAAVDIIREFESPAAVIIKHNNPCGVAQAETLEKAYLKAYKCDPLSAFGGIIGFNRSVDAKTASAVIKSGFMECIVAPEFTEEAKALFTPKKNLRLLVLDVHGVKQERYDFKKVSGGLLLQDKDNRVLKPEELKVVSKIKPTKPQMDAMIFGWKLIKHVKSNAIVLVKGTQTIGIGCGQTSRVDSAIHAIRRAGKSSRGSVMISDAFLPMPDTVTIAAKAGVKAIIQTGGSIMDESVIKEADKKKIAMVTTGIRHFKH